MKVTLNSITSGFAGITALNDNFNAIATAMENTVSRDGTTPNTMVANLDMNGYRILNALAQSGDGFIWEGAWVTATDYALNNLVQTTGNTYICTTAHTSGTFATDLAAGKWELLASKGASGAGSGDMVAANNLSELTDTNAARTNLGVAIGSQVQAYDVQLDTWSGVTPGTGVATALAVNVGSAGAPVVNGGALGTPSSGTLTNCTGYPVPAGSVVKIVEATPYTTYSSSATAMPYDDTIPQKTEGFEWVTVAITPTSATNRLRIEAEIPQCTSSVAEVIVAAIFQDAAADALAVSAEYAPAGSSTLGLRVSHEMAAGTTSATTFKLRAGSATGTIYVNGNSAARRLGGVSAIRMRVTEIAA